VEGRDGRAAKWFTQARKFPQLIGRTPDGTRLWGGPYTVTQLVLGGVVVLLLWNTTWLWAHFGLVGNIIVGLAIVYGAIYAAGKLPFGMRNPVVIGAGWGRVLARLWSAPIPAQIRRPHQAFGRDVLMIAPSTAADRSPHKPEAAPSTPPHVETPASAPPRPPVSSADPPNTPATLTGVQQLLAAGARR